MFDNLRPNLVSDYGGGDYPCEILFKYGWTAAPGAMFFGILMSLKPWKAHSLNYEASIDEKEVE